MQILANSVGWNVIGPMFDAQVCAVDLRDARGTRQEQQHDPRERDQVPVALQAP